MGALMTRELQNSWTRSTLSSSLPTGLYLWNCLPWGARAARLLCAADGGHRHPPSLPGRYGFHIISSGDCSWLRAFLSDVETEVQRGQGTCPMSHSHCPRCHVPRPLTWEHWVVWVLWQYSEESWGRWCPHLPRAEAHSRSVGMPDEFRAASPCVVTN